MGDGVGKAIQKWRGEKMAIDYPTLIGAKIHDLKNQMIKIIDQEEIIVSQLGEMPDILTQFNLLKKDTKKLSDQFTELVSIFNLTKNYRATFAEHWLRDDLEVWCGDFADGYDVEFDIQVPEELVWVYDAQVLRIGFHNAWLNSIAAGANQITLRAKTKRDYLHIASIDNGNGLPDDWPGVQEHIHNNPNGLGVSLIQQVCHTHKARGYHGRTELTNRESGRGVITHFLLP